MLCKTPGHVASWDSLTMTAHTQTWYSALSTQRYQDPLQCLSTKDQQYNALKTKISTSHAAARTQGHTVTYLMTISTTVSHWPEQHKPGRKCFTDTFCFLPMTCFTIPNWKWDKKDVVRHFQCLTYSYVPIGCPVPFSMQYQLSLQPW